MIKRRYAYQITALTGEDKTVRSIGVVAVKSFKAAPLAAMSKVIEDFVEAREVGTHSIKFDFFNRI